MRTRTEDWSPDGNGIGFACSLTATLDKIASDAAEVKKNYPDVRILIFATAGKVTNHTAGQWAYCLAGLRRLRQDFVNLLSRFASRGQGFESPHACADYSYACPMPEPTNGALMEPNGPELGR
jgi:hypothetical protein